MTGTGATGLRARPARQDDAALLLSWRNEPEVRERSRSTEEITPGSHAEWLRRTLASPDRHLLVVETDPEGTPVGTVRYDRLDATSTGRARWEISISVAAAMRGRGVGGATLRCADAWLRTAEAEAEEVVAHVRPDNAGSRRMFERNGYLATESAEPDMDCFVRRWQGR